MKISHDQMGHKVVLPSTPKRIISLVPSQTEFLFDLGLDEEIVGVTQFCTHPAEKVKLKTKIGGTKRFLLQRIKALEPDLIIGNKEENYPEGIAALQAHYPVWMSDITTLADAYAMLEEIGRLMDKELQAQQWVQKIKNGLLSLATLPKISAAYFIWRKPLMVAAKKTFIDSMLTQAGLVNVFETLTRYPVVTPDMLKRYHPQFILLASEPYPFKEKHCQEFQALFPEANVMIVDGQLFSWYGSRLQYAPEYFKNLR